MLVACYICACDNRNHYNPLQQTDNDDNVTVSDILQCKSNLQKDLKEIKVYKLLRREKWLLQKREEKRQSQPAKHWLQQWKKELDQQKDELEKRKRHYTLRKYHLPGEQYSTEILNNEVQEWNSKLDVWTSEITASEPNPVTTRLGYSSYHS